jgi:uncharacterized membrane protein
VIYLKSILERGNTLSELSYKKNFIRYVKEWINNNPGTAVGILIGLILGIMLFTLGIFKTILLLIFMLIGYWFGRNKDKNSTILEQITKIFRGGHK